MKNSILLVLASILLFSCGKKDENKAVLWNANNNMDASLFWINTNTVSQGITHSGLFSSKLDSLVEYGIGIDAKFSDITTSVPKKVKVHCWIYSTEANLDAGLVCDPNNNGQSINWQSFNLQTSISKANEWIEFKTSFDLPESITPDSQLKIFFWNPKKKIFYIDDIEITLE